MANEALQPLLTAMAARAAGKVVKSNPMLAKEADSLRRALDRDEWVFGPAGSKNTPIFGAAALGRFEDIGRACQVERAQGLWGLELGAPGLYFAGVLEAKLLALRELAAGQDGLRSAIRENVRAAFALGALVSMPVGRLRDRVLVGDGVLEGASPDLRDGLTTAIAGNRWTPRAGRGKGITSEDAWSVYTAWALDWQPRATRGPRGRIKGTMAGLLPESRLYSDPTPAGAWGLVDEEREHLRAVVRGDVDAARLVASTYLWGTRPARPPQNLNPWTIRLRRTVQGTEMVFFGPWPNPNKPARAATQVLLDGTWLGLQPSVGYRKPGPAEGYRAWIDDGKIWAESAQSNGPHSIPALGGDILWDVMVRGQSVVFATGQAAA